MKRFTATIAIAATAVTAVAAMTVNVPVAFGQGSSISELSSSGALRSNAPLPAEAGKLLARQRVDAARERIEYTSTNERGEIVPVTGAVYTPAGTPKGTIVMAPGTRGMGDQCAPSAGSSMLLRIEGSSANLNYEAPHAQRLVQEGYRVVVTDYIGMGSTGLHTYLNRVEQGHAVIDAGRAVTEPGEKVFFYGYSQGGAATAAAAELQPEYAPELNLVGVFAGAPPADPIAVLEQGNAKTLEGVASFVITSYSYSYPEFRDAIAEHAGPGAFRYLAAVGASCLAETSGSSAPLTRFSPKTMQEIVSSDERIRRVLAHNRLGNVPVHAPILIIHSPQDNLVPFGQGKQLADDYRALGSPVTFRAIEVSESSSESGLGHVVPAITENEDTIRWMNERFTDSPAS